MKVLVLKLGENSPSGFLLRETETMGMTVGMTRLSRGENVGAHSTGQNEEVLVFLSGRGLLIADGHQHEVGSGYVAYIGPHIEHDVLNTGQEELRYVFIVAPARSDGVRDIRESSQPSSGQANL